VKKAISIILITLFATALFAFNVSAGNIADTKVLLDLPDNGWYAGPERTKEDDTSIWFDYYSGGLVKVQPQGQRTNGYWYDTGPQRQTNMLTSLYLINYIYENHDAYPTSYNLDARLKLSAMAQPNFTAKYWWSPDSV
jgi:hypothetical protein